MEINTANRKYEIFEHRANKLVEPKRESISNSTKGKWNKRKAIPLVFVMDSLQHIHKASQFSYHLVQVPVKCN